MIKYKENQREIVGQKSQHYPWIGVRESRSISKPFPFLYWLHQFSQNIHHYFVETPKGCIGGCLTFWAFSGQLITPLPQLPKVDHNVVEGSFGVLYS